MRLTSEHRPRKHPLQTPAVEKRKREEDETVTKPKMEELAVFAAPTAEAPRKRTRKMTAKAAEAAIARVR